MVDDRRYVLCYNPEQARKDAQRRDHLLANLTKALEQNDAKSFIGNKGYRRFLKSQGGFSIDHQKAKREARYDGRGMRAGSQ